MSATYEDQWSCLAGAALLGTDRRPVPDPLPGPMSPFVDALDQVAVLVAARRAGLQPSRQARLLPAPAVDSRPTLPQRAIERLDEIVEQWPVLLDEWLDCAGVGGWRLAPEQVPSLLVRFRADPRRRQAIVALAGPLADWLIDLDLAPAGGARPAAPVEADLVPPPADMAVLWGLPGDQLAAALADGLTRAQLANRHRPLLVRLLCEVPVDRLPPVEAALARAGTNAATMGLALTLADLAHVRATMIEELLP